MYSQRDFEEINGKIRKNWLALAPVLAILLAAYVYALKAGVKWLAMLSGPLLFVAACYGVLAYIWPNTRYRNFLSDMQNGLSREVAGTILEISDSPELQDGATVLPVRVKLAPQAGQDSPARHASALAERLKLEEPEGGEDERIVYLNASKRELLPGPGAAVTLRCCGRHILAVEGQ